MRHLPLLILVALGAIVAPAAADEPWWSEHVRVPWAVDCTDEIEENGYENQGICVPGLISAEAWKRRSPPVFWGAMSSYDPGVMERVADYRNVSLSGYKDGAAVMGCGDLGRGAWIQLPSGDWYGPLLVIDCSARLDYFANAIDRGLGIEVGARAAEEIGARAIGNLKISLSGRTGASGPLYARWAVEQLQFVWSPALAVPTPTPSPTATMTATPTLRPTPTRATVPTPQPEAREGPMFLNVMLDFARQLSETTELIIAVLVTILLGAGGVRPIDWLKKVLGLSGLAALWFVFVVSFVVGAIALLLGGQLVGLEVTPETIGAVAGLFFMAATFVYKRLNATPQTP